MNYHITRNVFGKTLLLFLFLNNSIAVTAQAVEPGAEPPYWKWAQTLPMGWNSYDAWGTSITEQETLENARFMQERLAGARLEIYHH